GDVPGRERGGERLLIPGLEELDPAGQRLEGCPVGLFRGEREGAHGASMEGLRERQDAGTAGAARDPERRLVRLRARVREEHGGAGRSLSELEQRLGELDLRGGGEEVRDVP